MADYKQAERNRRALRRRMREELKAQGVKFVTIEPPQPRLRIEETPGGGRRMMYRDICGMQVRVDTPGRRTASGDCLVLRLDRANWRVSGTIQRIPHAAGRAVWRNDLQICVVDLEEDVDVCQAVDQVVHAAVQHITLKM